MTDGATLRRMLFWGRKCLAISAILQLSELDVRGVQERTAKYTDFA
jgi:hypothetical protein